MEKINLSLKNNRIVILFLFAFSFILLYFSTASSPRYATNPWNDANAFFSVGKAMANGIIPYKDIFEQKGPLLYFIHAIAYRISNSSFLGVYILESLNASLLAYYAFKISSLYLNKVSAVISSTAFLAFIVNTDCFYYGDSAEEFSLSLMAISLYQIMWYFKNSSSNSLRWYQYFASGFLAGCVAMIKFTLIGFWFGWMASLAIQTLFIRKQIKNAFLNSFIFIGGMVLSFIPWIIYFAINNGLSDFIKVYFVINSTAYANNNDFLTKVFDIIFFFNKRLILYHTLAAIPALFGAVCPVFFKYFHDGKVYSRFVPFILFSCCDFFIYYGGQSFVYYFLPLAFFSLFSFIFIIKILDDLLLNKNKPFKKAILVVLPITLVSVSAFYGFTPKYTLKDINQTYNKKVYDYIESHNADGSILCYQKLDMGIYLLSNYTDFFKYFELQNLNHEKFKDNIECQNSYINNHEAYYVVTSIPKEKDIYEFINENNPILLKDYKLMLQEDYTVYLKRNGQCINETCYLFELKN